MVIGPKKLLQLVRTKKLVEGLTRRELENPEGAGFDLRLGELYQISGKAYLGITHRETPQVELVASFDDTILKRSLQDGKAKSVSNVSQVTIKPGEFYLATTVEKVNLPINICATFIPRTTTFRSGLFLRTGVAQPGYKGKLTFGLKNEGPVPVTLEMGCRFVHAQFHFVEGGGSLYRGQWQGGRVTTKKREKQV